MSKFDPKGVFINAPFDSAYEPGRDLYIHSGTRGGMIATLLDAFQSHRFEVAAFREALRELDASVQRMKRSSRLRDIFHPHPFASLTSAASLIAEDYGFIPADAAKLPPS